MTNRFGITLLVLIVVCAALPGSPPAAAQPDSDPIILELHGDLWAWHSPDQPLEQLTSWGRNWWPILSPDGTHVAYASGVQIVSDWLESVGGGGGFMPPLDIWVLDIASGQALRVADQPEDAVYNGPNRPGKYILRAMPAWSPDGTQLAWVEVAVDGVSAPDDAPSITVQLVRHDITSGITTSVGDLPPDPEGLTPELYSVTWGASGIGVAVGVLEWATIQEYRVYDDSGALISQMLLPEDSSARMFYAAWISAPDQDYLFDPADIPNTVYNSPDKTWYNWRTGNEEPMMLTPEMVSLTAPDGARIFASEGTWHVAFPGQTPVDLGEHVRLYGIARDGQAVLYGRWEVNPATNGHAYTLLVHSADAVVEIGRFSSVFPVWGPVAWRVRQ